MIGKKNIQFSSFFVYCIFDFFGILFFLNRITWTQAQRRRRLDIPTGQQTYRAVKVKLILLVTNDQKTKNVIKFNNDFLFQHIFNYIILYWGKEDFLKKANFALKWLFNKKITGFREKLWTFQLSAIMKHMILVKHKNLKNVCGLLYYVYRSVDL